MTWLLATTTAESEKQARVIGTALVEEKLAACFQIAPITSIYRWEGPVEESPEFICQIKTADRVFERLAARVKELHSYDVPELIAVPISNVSEDYGKWLDESIAE